MTRRKFWVLSVVLAIASLVAAYSIAGMPALAGLSLGLGATWLVLFALWQMIKMLGRSFTGEGAAKSGTFLIILIFLMKLPLYVWLASVARALEEPAPTCFLLGVALVYSLLVGWASLEK